LFRALESAVWSAPSSGEAGAGVDSGAVAVRVVVVLWVCAIGAPTDASELGFGV
jgi:hypothetical protein